MSASEYNNIGTKNNTSEETQSESNVTSNAEALQPTSRANGAELNLDDIFELLKNPRRRTVIDYLKDNDGEATLSEVAEHIAALENGITVEELSSHQRKRVYIGLYQCHLPKMDKLGVIDYDKNRGTIEIQDSVEQLEPFLEFEEDDEDFGQLVVGIALGVSFLVFIGIMGPFTAIPATGWALISVAGMLTVALLHVVR